MKNTLQILFEHMTIIRTKLKVAKSNNNLTNTNEFSKVTDLKGADEATKITGEIYPR